MSTDQRLARRAAAGEQRAFATIFERYHQRLYRYCLAVIGDPQDAQDALQNTMAKVLRSLPGEERSIELKPWLYRIAHNESIELLRRRREGIELEAELAAAGPSLAEEAETRERLRRLLSDLDELPERQRGALVMRELAGLGYEQIGAALGTSPAVARQALYEARLSLHEMDEGREMRCDSVTKALSDGDGRVARRRDIRAHLRTCPDCRHFREEIATRKRDLAAISPLPAAVVAGLFKGLIGAQGGGGAGVAAALGGGAAKTVGTSVALKGAATVAVVAAIGVGAADRGGLIHLGPGGRDDAQAPARSAPGGFTDPDARTAERAGKVSAGHPRAGAPVRTEAERGIQATRATAAPRSQVTVPGGADSAAAPVESGPGGKSATHASGKGHEKQLPAASAHGQETAAAHKAAEHGTSKPKSSPAHPDHPSHPATPATTKDTPSAPPTSGGSAEPQPNESVVDQPGQGAPPAAPPGKP